ncbi:MAG: hypothetical protein L3J68_00135 [Thermoplasmata archaeon]|nr:hypothetical protein [Thermoplasmata archaeon]
MPRARHTVGESREDGKMHWSMDDSGTVYIDLPGLELDPSDVEALRTLPRRLRGAARKAGREAKLWREVRALEAKKKQDRRGSVEALVFALADEGRNAEHIREPLVRLQSALMNRARRDFHREFVRRIRHKLPLDDLRWPGEETWPEEFRSNDPRRFVFPRPKPREGHPQVLDDSWIDLFPPAVKLHGLGASAYSIGPFVRKQADDPDLKQAMIARAWRQVKALATRFVSEKDAVLTNVAAIRSVPKPNPWAEESIRRSTEFYLRMRVAKLALTDRKKNAAISIALDLIFDSSKVR